MNNFLIIYTILIILFLYLFNAYQTFNISSGKDGKNSKSKENFHPQKNTPNFVKDYLNKKVSDAPNYRVENINQFNFDRLYKKLQLINKEKIKLDGPLRY